MTEALVDDDFIADWGHPTHSHDYHQFLFVPVDHITVTALGATYRVTPSTGLWIPAHVPHSARFAPGSVIIAELFDPAVHRLRFTEPTPVSVTGEQRSLLLSRARSTQRAADESHRFAILASGVRAALPLPWPTSPAAVAVARELTRDPGDLRTADAWARAVYTSSTSLRRAFRAETGLPFSEWRTRLRLNSSLDLLEEGRMVNAVAAKVGFTSTNGYILAFRRHFGQTPGAYVRAQIPHAETV